MQLQLQHEGARKALRIIDHLGQRPDIAPFKELLGDMRVAVTSLSANTGACYLFSKSNLTWDRS